MNEQTAGFLGLLTLATAWSGLWFAWKRWVEPWDKKKRLLAAERAKKLDVSLEADWTIPWYCWLIVSAWSIVIAAFFDRNVFLGLPFALLGVFAGCMFFLSLCSMLIQAFQASPGNKPLAQRPQEKEEDAAVLDFEDRIRAKR
jgi:hypothetical protein